jgi:hypothetical protein
MVFFFPSPEKITEMEKNYKPPAYDEVKKGGKLMRARDYMRAARRGIGSSIKADLEYKQKCKEDIEALVQSYLKRIKRMITLDLNEKVCATPTPVITMEVINALRPMEIEDLKKAMIVYKDGCQYAEHAFYDQVKDGVQNWLESNGLRVVAMESCANTLRLVISLRGATRLRGLVRFIIVCARYRRDFYSPGAAGYVSAKESFEKQLST